MFSDQKDYNVQWKNRVGFAKIALEAQIPIILVFTRNIREAVRTLVTLQNGDVRVNHIIDIIKSIVWDSLPSGGKNTIWTRPRRGK